MNINELELRLLGRKRNTGTIFDNGYNSGIDDCLRLLEQFHHSITKDDLSNDDAISKVDHPLHYNREGAMECIDEMVVAFGKEATITFCILNAWKYRYRAGFKDDSEEDLKKSDWYIKKAAELKSPEEVDEITYYCMNEHTGSVEPYITTKYKK